MNSAGTPEDASAELTETSFQLRREIPPCYVDENERWVLEASGWTNFAWDISSEDESVFERGEIPLSVEPGRAAQVVEEEECASHFSFDDLIEGSNVLPTDGDSGLTSTVHIDESESHALVQPSLPNVLLAHPVANTQAYAVTPESKADATVLAQAVRSSLMPFPSLPTTPTQANVGFRSSAPTMHTPSPVPSLSPSGGSTCSSEDSDWEIDVPAPMIAKLNLISRSETQSPLPKKEYDPRLDAEFFAHSFPAGRPLPALFFPPASAYQVPVPILIPKAPVCAPTIDPALIQMTSMHTTQALNFPSAMPVTKSTSGAGPNRTSSSRSSRSTKPYERKAEASNKEKPKPLDEYFLKPIFICDECEYTQAPGPGAQRSFKRHLETHARYKKFEWRCRGKPYPPHNLYAGGCNKVFARKDALQRHVNSTRCASDFLPCKISHGYDMFEA